MKARILILLAACLSLPCALAAEPVATRAATSKADPGAAEIPRRITALRRASAELRAAAKLSPPKGITPEDAAKAQEYDNWLQQASDRLDALAVQGDQALEAGASAEIGMSFNLQYLQLQSQMQHENRSYTAVSNIMKTKHDTVKNSISNIR